MRQPSAYVRSAMAEDEASFGWTFRIHFLCLPIHLVLRNRFFSVIAQVFQTKMIISGYGTHFWNVEIKSFIHHPDILFSIVPCLYALLIQPIHMAPTNAVLFRTNQEVDR